MLGSTHLTLVMGAAPSNTAPTPALKSYVRALADAGLSVLFIQPGTKIPDDLRSAQAKKKAAQAGDDRAGLYLATSDKATLARYVEAARKKYGDDAALNLAVHAGRSRHVIIDADTPEEVQSWISWWSQATGEDMAGVPPTVTTPGAQGADGAWKHHGGGHWYMALPEGFEVPERTPAKVKVGAATAYVGDAYVLIPPSTRPEGRYEMTGTDYEAPQALLDLLVPPSRAAKKERDRTPAPPAATRERATQAREDAPEGQVSLEEWLNDTPWAEILDGWEITGTDKCGCAQWVAPGLHDSPKSAVTHEGCGDHEDGGRLHVWSDNPQTGTPLDDEVAAGRKSFSKLQAYAWMHHDGDDSAAMDALGLARGVVKSGGGLLEWRTAEDGTREQVTYPTPTTPEEWDAWADRNTYTRPDLKNLPTLQPLVKGWLNKASTAAIIGESGSLKSFHVVDLVGCITTGRPYHGAEVAQGPVLLAIGEGLEGMDKRLQAWEDTYNGGREMDNLHFWPVPIELHEAGSEQVAAVARKAARVGAVFVVFDTLARFAAGANDSSSQDMGLLVQNLGMIRDMTGACVMVVHHTTRDTDHGRGSTALLGAWDTEILAKRKGKTEEGSLKLTQQKHAAEGEPVAVRAVHVDLDGDDDGSLVIRHETDVPEEKRATSEFHRPAPKGADDRDWNIQKLAYEIHHVFRGDFTPYGQIKDAAKKRLGASTSPFYTAFNGLRDQGYLEQHPEDAGKDKAAHLSRWRVADTTIREWNYPSREELAQSPISPTAWSEDET